MLKCDRCGAEMTDTFEMIDGSGRSGGNCPNCGDNLCADCAGEWDEPDGVCAACNMILSGGSE